MKSHRTNSGCHGLVPWGHVDCYILASPPQQDAPGLSRGGSRWELVYSVFSCRGVLHLRCPAVSVKLHGASPWHLSEEAARLVSYQHEPPPGEPVVSRRREKGFSRESLHRTPRSLSIQFSHGRFCA